ncbi:MAG TPA: sialidase family protein [Chthonomonadales bacterium]|nr:sialidase family protein [Chthonomonadales bacterium]
MFVGKAEISMSVLLTLLTLVAYAEDLRPRPLPPLDRGIMIARLPDRRLIGVFQREVNGNQEVAARYSSDNGTTWTAPEVFFTLPKDPGNWYAGEILVDREGELHIFLLNNARTGFITRGEGERVLVGEDAGYRLDIGYMRSTNGRKNWTPPRMVWMGYTGALNSVIQMSNGRILLPFSYRTKRTWSQRGEGLDQFTFMGQYNSTLIYSDDGGENWHLAASSLKIPVPDIVSAYGAVEPVVLQLKDGRVWMLIRGQTGRFYESFSQDGSHWSPPRPSAITSSDSPAGIVRLDDGRIVLFWNNCQRYPYAYGGRQVLHAAISEDEGKTWRGYREVGRDPLRHLPPPPGGDFGTAYPFPMVANDNKVIFVSGQGEGRVLRMILDPKWLYETVQKADFSTRQDEWSIFGTKGVDFVPHPTKPDSKVLEIRKPYADWPAGAVWNFPSGAKGHLRMKIYLREGFAGALIGLTDHFSTAFDIEDRFYNLYNLEIGPGGRLPNGKRLEPNRWYDLQLDWDGDRGECRVTLDGRPLTRLHLTRDSVGVCYLRLRSTTEETDNAGFLIADVVADVSRSWQGEKR